MFPIGTKVHFFEGMTTYSLLVAGFNEQDNTYLLNREVPDPDGYLGYPVPKHLVFGSISELNEFYKSRAKEWEQSRGET